MTELNLNSRVLRAGGEWWWWWWWNMHEASVQFLALPPQTHIHTYMHT